MARFEPGDDLGHLRVSDVELKKVHVALHRYVPCNTYSARFCPREWSQKQQEKATTRLFRHVHRREASRDRRGTKQDQAGD